MQAIPKPDVHRIQSAQVITSLAHATKELLENAIDAGASKITIKLVNHGLDLIEVSDNGSGISEADHATLAQPHATSKLRQFSDLESLETLGFRGEALGSLCALSTFTVKTCTAATYPMGALLTYDATGVLTASKAQSAQIGTTVRVEGLFASLPVRRKDFEKNAKREFAKAVKLLSAYAAIQAGIKMEIVHHPDGKGNKRVSCLGAQGTSGSGQPMKTMVEIFGAKLAGSLLPLDLTSSLHVSGRRSLAETGQARAQRLLVCRGFVSRPWSEYGGMADRQLISINQRPCSLPALAKVVTSLYQGAGGHKQPFFLLDLTLPPDAYDVNVSPDKRTIFLHNQEIILDAVRNYLQDLFTDDRRVMPGVVVAAPIVSQQQSQLVSSSYPERESVHLLTASITHAEESEDEPQGCEESAPTLTPINITGFTLRAPSETLSTGLLKRKRLDTASRPARAASGTSMRQTALPFKTIRNASPELDSGQDSGKDGTRSDSSMAEESASDKGEDPMNEDEDGDRPADSDAESTPAGLGTAAWVPLATAEEEEAVRPRSNGVQPLPLFAKRLHLFENSTPALHLHQQSVTSDSAAALVPIAWPTPGTERVSMRRDVVNAGLTPDAEAAASSLSLSVSKTDFFGMHIVGQFNLGFIITTRKGELFIIDQHASDEKSRYEQLRRETQMATQRLARPKELDLSSSQRLVLADSLTILKQNGFEVSEAEEAEEQSAADGWIRQRYHLTSVPQSKNISFDVSDLVEILDRIAEQSSTMSAASDETHVVRCRKAERMFASRACRSSVMIGTALTRERMQSVVYHMGELQKPWNCPHGRPTMRHLANIAATIPGFREDYV